MVINLKDVMLNFIDSELMSVLQVSAREEEKEYTCNLKCSNMHLNCRYVHSASICM